MNEKNIYYTDEIDAFQTDKATLAIAPVFTYAEPHEYNKVFLDKKTKIKLDLNDFSNGKGDAANHNKFNLSLSMFRRLKRMVFYGTIKKEQFYEVVSYDMYPEREGAMAGNHKVLSITIEYVPEINGKPMRNPFKLEIKNGYAKQGEQKATMNQTSGKIWLKEEFLAEIIEQIQDAIDEAKLNYVVSGRYEKGRALVEEQKKKYKKEEVEEPTSTNNTSSEPVNTVNTTVTPATTETKPEIEIHPVSGKFISDFQKLENCSVASFEIKGKVFPIYFKEVPEPLVTSRELGVDVTINIYQYGDKFIFDSLV